MDEEFRAEVREFIKEALPADLAERTRLGYHQDREDIALWTRKLAARGGWSVPGWPVEHGGPGWTIAQRHAFDEECFLAGAPGLTPQGTFLVGPILIAKGTPEQQARFLPKIRDGSEFWAQGFSEPESGSDLASLKTAARREGDHYVVDGSKIWTSAAHTSDWVLLLVRTRFEGKPQAGISMLLVDLKTPGIQIRPLISIDGRHTLNQVFFTNVIVPAENLVGEENGGWSYGKEVLVHERTFNAEVGRCRSMLARVRRVASEARHGAEPIIEDPHFAFRLAEAEVDFLAHQATLWRSVAEETAGVETSAHLPSVLKVRGAEIVQRIGALMLEALGDDAVVLYPESWKWGFPQDLPGPVSAPGVVSDFLFRRAMTIYGGSNEVQRNLIAGQVMKGL